MAEPTDVQRRLVAVFAADVEGYSRLMGADEVGTLKGLTERRAILDKAIADHRGRIANTAGDSVLAEFGSAVDAVQCAVEAQAALAEVNAGLTADKCINFRIAIHVGDVMVRAGDLFGDGVNIAARLQTLAQPGGVCVSGTAHEHVRKVLPVAFTDLGAQRVKNIEEPVKTYAVSGRLTTAVGETPRTEAPKPLPLPDKPSIAVLPFQNMSGDPEQEYFADGIVEDITTGLSRSKLLFVIARNSSFTYKGKAIDIQQVGRDLGVRYVVEGSVRKAGSRVRITGQLIDTSNSAHIWADHFDGQLENIFDFQDRVTASIIGAIYPRVEGAEIARAQSKPTENLQAYDCYLRALAHDYRFTREDNQAVLKFTEMANRLDPEYARPYAMGAMAFLRRKNFGWIVDAADEIARARRLVSHALELGRDDAVVLANTGWVHSYLFDEVELGSTLVTNALQLDPNLFSARQSAGWINVYLGNLDIAAAHFQAVLRISPLDPRIFMAQNGMAFVHFYLGQYEEGLAWATTAFHRQPNYLANARAYFCLLAMSGRIDEAKKVAADALQNAPSMFRISEIRRYSPLRREVDLDRLRTAYRIAGLPE